MAIKILMRAAHLPHQDYLCWSKVEKEDMYVFKSFCDQTS